jgi:hypothetical protein
MTLPGDAELCAQSARAVLKARIQTSKAPKGTGGGKFLRFCCEMGALWWILHLHRRNLWCGTVDWYHRRILRGDLGGAKPPKVKEVFFEITLQKTEIIN